VAIGAGIATAYHAGIQVVYTTLAYEIAADSPEATKALFVLTILGVPVLGAGVAALLGGLAYGARAARLVPAWMVALSVLGAVVSCVALVSLDESDLFSPMPSNKSSEESARSGRSSPAPCSPCGGADSWRDERRSDSQPHSRMVRVTRSRRVRRWPDRQCCLLRDHNVISGRHRSPRTDWSCYGAAG
jgi:hypothetical protein